MLFTLVGIFIFVRLEHMQNASSPMLLTLFGIVTLVRPLHFSKAHFPILVILLEREILFIFSHPRNIRPLILVTPDLITTDVISDLCSRGE